MEDGRLCVQWRKIRDGKLACWLVVDRGGGEYDLTGAEGADDVRAKLVKR